eukprot:gene5255-5308_t
MSEGGPAASSVSVKLVADSPSLLHTERDKRRAAFAHFSGCEGFLCMSIVTLLCPPVQPLLQ